MIAVLDPTCYCCRDVNFCSLCTSTAATDRPPPPLGLCRCACTVAPSAVHLPACLPAYLATCLPASCLQGVVLF